MKPVCPLCRGELKFASANRARCADCGAIFPERARVPVLLPEEVWACVEKEQYGRGHAHGQYAAPRRTSALTQMYYDWWTQRMFAECNGCPARVVELMCGEAEMCRRLPMAVREAVAIDLNVQFVQVASEALATDGRVTCLCASATAIPLPDGCADAVLIQGGLHHVRPILSTVLREIRRILAPGGVLVASEPANDNPLIRAIRRWEYAHSALHGKDEGEDGFTRQELETLLGEAGLTLHRYRIFGLIGYPLLATTHLLPLLAGARSRWLGRVLIGLDERLSTVPVINRFAFASMFSAMSDGK